MDIFANLGNPRHWFNPEPGAPGPAFIVFAAIAVVAFLIAAYIRWRRRLLFPGDGLKLAMAVSGSSVAMWLAGIAVFLIVMRYGNVPYLATPVLFYLNVLAAIAAAGYGIYYYTQVYPHQRDAYAARSERERYLPTARRGANAAGSGGRASRQRAVARRR